MADRRHALTCRAVGGKPAPTITWQSPRGEAVDLDPGVQVEHMMPGLDGRGGAVSRLMLTPTKQDNGREVVCRVINAAMTEAMEVSTTLRVLCESESFRYIERYSTAQTDSTIATVPVEYRSFQTAA